MLYEFEVIYFDGTTRIETIPGHQASTHQAAWFPLLRKLRDYETSDPDDQKLGLVNVVTISPIR